jgi:thioredoxin-related protein
MCRKMTREVYTDPSVIKFSRSQVFMRVFEDTEEEGARMARKYKITGFPTLIILDSEGREVDRILGALSPEELLDQLNSICKDGKSKGYTI